MTGCSVSAKKYCVFGCGSFLLLAALLLGLLWPTLMLRAIHSELQLRNGTQTFDNWVETPLPMYFEFTLFNWTNPSQVNDPNVNPILVEMGPYVFEEKQFRNSMEWHPENDTISYNQTRTWFFVPELSNGTLDDEVTNLHVITASVVYAARDMNAILKAGLNIILATQGGAMATTKPVREWIFDGWEDNLLNFLRSSEIPGVSLPFDRFGWFYGRNESSSYDGRFNMFTGQEDLGQVGRLNTWNGENRTNYRDGCGAINGTTGELWPPNMQKRPITMFTQDICRSLTLSYENETEHLGIAGLKYAGDDSLFDNGVNYPEMECFCTSDVSLCPDLAPGVLNISDCRFGAPIFVSFPHFYLADPSYGEEIDGLEPDKEKHEFMLALEPSNGIPLDVKARLQINILLQPISGFTLFSSLPRRRMMPMFWFTQRAELTEELAPQARLAIIMPFIGVYAAYGIASIGLILLSVGAILGFTKSWNRHSRLQNEGGVDNELHRE